MIVKKRKGISTFIATLLLMVLAVSAGVVIYAYTMGYLGGFGGPQPMGSIVIDTWILDPGPEGDGLSLWIRNIGKASFEIDSIYVNGEKVADKGVYQMVIPENDKEFIQILYATEAGDGYYPWGPGKTYEVKIVGIDNTQLIFQVKK